MGSGGNEALEGEPFQGRQLFCGHATRGQSLEMAVAMYLCTWQDVPVHQLQTSSITAARGSREQERLMQYFEGSMV